MSYSYTLNCGQYVLTRDGSPIGPLLDEVSIAFDREHGTLHKHGEPGSVRRWVKATQDKLRAGGANQMADNLIVMTGRFELDEINRCLDCSGYAGRLYAKASKGELAALSLDGVAKIAPASKPVAPVARRRYVRA